SETGERGLAERDEREALLVALLLVDVGRSADEAELRALRVAPGSDALEHPAVFAVEAPETKLEGGGAAGGDRAGAAEALAVLGVDEGLERGGLGGDGADAGGLAPGGVHEKQPALVVRQPDQVGQGVEKQPHGGIESGRGLGPGGGEMAEEVGHE